MTCNYLYMYPLATDILRSKNFAHDSIHIFGSTIVICDFILIIFEWVDR